MRRFLPATLLACAACAGAEPSAPVDTGLPVRACDADWAGVENVFARQCDSCHPSHQGVDLHEAVPADLDNGEGRFIVPFEPDLSPLYQRMLGAPVDLPEADVACVYDWIVAGAPIP